jgi:uncharacterized protein
MLPARHRLHSSHEITRTLREGRKHGSRHVVTHVRQESGLDVGPPRAAFAVSKAVGNSVVRHRLTRQLRSAILPLLQQLPPGTDIVVRALPASASASYSQLVSDLQRCLRGYLAAPEQKESVHISAASPEIQASAASGQSEHARGPIGTTLFILGTPLRLVLLGLVMAYRMVISPILPPTCRFHPSCSAYALESLQTHGAAKGAALAGWRLLRCHPWSGGGLDPVPRRGYWRPDIHPDGSPRQQRTVGCGDEPRATSAVAPT